MQEIYNIHIAKRRDFPYWFGIGLVVILCFYLCEQMMGANFINPDTILSLIYSLFWLGMTPVIMIIKITIVYA